MPSLHDQLSDQFRQTYIYFFDQLLRGRIRPGMRVLNLALKILAILAAAYLVLCGAILAIMMQPPLRFAKAIAKVPGPMFMALPFETLWSYARGGQLHPGDPAPDFDLPTLDKTARVRLSSFQGSRPVVLIFGSYT